jgi:hypothetical protein
MNFRISGSAPIRKMLLSLFAVSGFAIAAAAPGQPRAANLTSLVSFCALTNCPDGANPYAGLITDANGNLFGTTEWGGAYGEANGGGYGTVFEIAGSGFVPPPVFAGTPGKIGCIVKSDATLIKDYHGLNNAAADLGYPGILTLEKAILTYCWGV